MPKWLATALAITAVVAAGNAFAEPAHYQIRYDGGRVMHVQAKLPAGDGRLLIAMAGGIDHLPNQWATFVRDLRAAARDGHAIETRAAGKEGWTADWKGPLNLNYDVSLDYAIGKWPAGNEQSGRLFPSALYTVTKPLFLYTSGVTDAIVRFDGSPNSKIATPWESSGTAEFRAPSVDALIDNSIVIGEFPATEIRVGAFDITVATPGMSEMPPLLVSATKQIGVVATNLFNKTPRGKYLMTFFREDDEDGESYQSSAAITSPAPFDRPGMIVTGNTLVHELLHHWIGGMIAPADHDSIAWLTEGFTEYYANMAIARSGAVTPEILLRKFSNLAAGYLYFCESPLFNGVTVADAGRRKGSYRFGVYNGGWAVALSLDVLLRSESDGRRSLDDVMRLLFEANGLTGKPLTVPDIRSAVNQVAQRDMGSFFETYIDKRNELPIAATLSKLGIEMRGQSYAADLYLITMAAPNPQQLEMRRAMLGF